MRRTIWIVIIVIVVIATGWYVWEKSVVVDGHLYVNPSVVDKGNGIKQITTVEDVKGYYGGDKATGKVGYFTCTTPIKAKVTRTIYTPGPGPTPNVPLIVPLDDTEAQANCKLTSEGLPLENEGKITVLQKPEVQKLISQYGEGEVQLKALKFSYIEDKGFMERLLPIYKGRDIGCIIVLTTPGSSRVYVEDEKLQTFEELDYGTFEDYLNSASPADKQLFLDNLH